jgi:flagellar basal-body rod protein FlgG
MHEQGSLAHTGNELDIGLEGQGFFQIVKPNGQISYTRAGDFKLNADGQIVTSDGLLLEPQLTVPEDTTVLEISPDGVVSAIQQGNPDPLELGQIEIANFVNPAGLLSLGRNLYSETAASGAPVVGTPGDDGLGTLGQGFLEQSNVKVVDEMVNMIIGQRAYEMSSKAIQASDQMLRTVAQLR